MTDDRRSDDELLAEQIRAAMAHYTFAGPLRPARTVAPWRWPVLAGAVLAGAMAATLVISALGGLPRGPVGDASPTPLATGSPEDSAPHSPVPGVAPISERLAGEMCRDPNRIVDDWILPGETSDDVMQRLRQLPLVHADQRSHAAFFLYADDRFTIECQVDHGEAGPELSGVAVGPREPHDGGLEYSGGGSAPGSQEPGERLPDLYMFGTAGPRFVRVEVVMADGGARPAWLGDGLWFVWWNEPISSVAIRGYDADGNVTTLDEGLTAHVPEPEETPQPTPWPGLPTQFDGVHDACATESTDIPQQWILPGELRGQVLQRMRRLPLINVDIRDVAASYLFADTRFVIECRIYRTAPGAEPEVSVARTLRDDPGDGLIYSFGSAAGPGGGTTGSRPADLLMVGSAAPRFERVEVVLDDGSTVPAVLANGMWLAWWNTPRPAVEVRGYEANGSATSIAAVLEIARSTDG